MGELVDNDQEMFPSSPATTKLSGANPVPFVNRVLDSDDGGGGGGYLKLKTSLSTRIDAGSPFVDR